MHNLLRKISLIICSATALAGSSITPLWLRDAKISPDGQTIAFAYRGDIFTVPVVGGRASRLTSHPGYEATPIWSGDSRKIAFASDRHGNFDIFVIDAEGGTPKRLTYNSASETPEAFTPDGKYVVFSASIQDPVKSAMHPTARMTELYKVSIDGGNPEQIIGTPAQMISYAPGGKWFAYQDLKGFEDEWRKHHTSSVTRDIWRYDIGSGKHTNLTQRAGEDRNPVVSPDGKTIYILSERDGGTMNVYAIPVASPATATQLTRFERHPVRFLSGAADGTLAFTYDGEIYTMRPGSEPTKVAISIVEDWESPIEKKTLSSGANSYAISPDGKEIALTARGEVLVTSVEYPTTKLVSSTPQAENHVQWGSDARELVYTSDRTGKNNIYTARLSRKEDPNFPNATAIEETALFPNDGVERSQPKYSPDGSQLAFVANRTDLMVMDVATKEVKQLSSRAYNPQRGQEINFAWSPDGKWIVFEGISSGREPYSDIMLIDVEKNQIHPLTETGYFDESPRWAMDGQAILFLSERYGMRNHASWGSQYDAMLIFLNQDAYDRFKLSPEDYELQKEAKKSSAKKSDSPKKEDDNTNKADAKKKATDNKDGDKPAESKKKEAKPTKVELAGIEDRIVRLTPNSSSMLDAVITPDGETLYYLTRFEKGVDLWKIALRKDEIKRVSKLGSGSYSLAIDDAGKNLFAIGSKAIKKMDLKSEKLSDVTYSATMNLNPAAEREYMYRDMALQERERFYDEAMHGVDWDGLVSDYAKFLPHIANNYDYAEMLSELLGELNVSHTGGRFRPVAVKPDRTASLGLLYDMSYKGAGLKVAEIVEGGPLDRTATQIKPGIIIEAIGDSILSGSVDYAAALCDISGKKTLLHLYNPSNGKRWEEVVIPISSGKMSDLLYNRWVKARAADVDRWSGGRLGYVHISSMNDDSFRKAYADMMGKYAKRDGVVVDIRWNGGGRLHEDIEVLLSGEKYLTQVIRGQETCDMPSRRWNKPSIMVMAEPCYSNAHGTPWVYKHQNIGKLVGMPVPGTMTSVNWVTMQDPTLVYGIPVIGYRTAEGTYLENSQLEPDIRVANSPEVIVNGEDQQLKAAVTELLKEIDSKR